MDSEHAKVEPCSSLRPSLALRHSGLLAPKIYAHVLLCASSSLPTLALLISKHRLVHWSDIPRAEQAYFIIKGKSVLSRAECRAIWAMQVGGRALVLLLK